MNFADDTTIFLGSVNCFARLKVILKLNEKASSSKNWAPRARTYENRTDKLRKMIWSQSLTKILGIHFGNSILNNNDWDKINDHIHKKIIFET